jgi:ADP-ribosylglycohydrolase
MTISKEQRQIYSKNSLLGLSVGDSFGETFFFNKEVIIPKIENRELMSLKWRFTDDTVMAISVFKNLEKYGEIKQQNLADLFARNYMAEVTHFHPEGKAGAIAIALTAGLVLKNRLNKLDLQISEFYDLILKFVPNSDTKEQIKKAAAIPSETPIDEVVSILGNGSKVISQDTVPFCIWSALNFKDNFENALWKTVSALGDRDTTCAIVGGIVVLNTGIEGIPDSWLDSTESVEKSPFWG